MALWQSAFPLEAGVSREVLPRCASRRSAGVSCPERVKDDRLGRALRGRATYPDSLGDDGSLRLYQLPRHFFRVLAADDVALRRPKPPLFAPAGAKPALPDTQLVCHCQGSGDAGLLRTPDGGAKDPLPRRLFGALGQRACSMNVSIPSGQSLGKQFSASVDAVVIGSGAGGAVATHALAEAGLQVLCVEEGPYLQREEFSGRLLDATHKLYRLDGMTLAIGRPAVVIPMGSSIGGTTTINAGTSFRTPDERIEHWREHYGHTATVHEMAAHFDALEQVMPVAPVPAALLGGNSAAVQVGAEKLGWSAGPIPRNAPQCHGCCRCVLGCPEDAKLSMNISFVPA